ncbi:Peptide transporter PTR2 [Talaromyces islandicus]|uniref:Peptide transporter PTR2 n=1 Tax=Talaromyces islandicus TaxID=28573 RepID=A0A0U1LK34_TALIS|nr:Peptide transporter PTR2 [Talaromyces islandicus]
MLDQEESATSRTPLLQTSNSDSTPRNVYTYGTETGDSATEQQQQHSLRRVADSLPLNVWIIATIEACERFAFFGMAAPLQNYVQNSRDDPLRPGGIGLGQAYATIVNLSFIMWCFVTPVVGAVVAEQYLGRLRTVTYASLVYICGLSVLVVSSLPLAHDRGLSFSGMFLSLFLIGIGTGGIKTNVNSLIAEQYTGPKKAVQVLKSGEKVLVDKDLTLQRIFTTFFIYVNIGSVTSMVTTPVEKYYGFTAAFALPLVVFFVGLVIILASKDRYVSHPPDKSLLFNAGRVLWIALKNRGHFHHASPSHQDEADPAERLPWDDVFVDDIRKTLVASKVFVLYPFFWAAYSQYLTNFVSQAATMETHGIPNDIMTAIDPVSVLILLPTLDRIIFPFVRKLGASLLAADRVRLGFIICGIAMLYAAFVQHMIYLSPPCYNHPRSLDCFDGKVPNSISVFWQAPSYLFIALAECFAAVAGVEYAYAAAPKSMKSIVIALYMSSASVGAILAMTVSPLTVDPELPWMYVTLGMGVLVAGGVLCIVPV